MTTRRKFLAASTALLAASAANATLPSLPDGDRLAILLLGGTGFIGPHQIEYALASGHEVSTFR